MILDFLKIQIYLLFVIIILCISEILKSKSDFSKTLLSLLSFDKYVSKKAIFSFIVAILGILPIPGRIVLINFILDSISSKNDKTSYKLGILSYISTHHYYLWSPIETSIIISMGILNLSYREILGYTIIPLISYITCFILYIIFFIKEEDFKNVEVVEENKLNIESIKDIFNMLLTIVISVIVSNEIFMVLIFFHLFMFLKYKYNIPFKDILIKLDYKFILSIFIILLIGFIIKNNIIISKEYLLTITNNNMFMIFFYCFIFSFILGSSARFSTIASTVTLALGMQYFTLLYIIDYCGYLLSPIHKCTYYILSFFNFNFRFYIYLIIQSLIVFIPALILFIYN